MWNLSWSSGAREPSSWNLLSSTLTSEVSFHFAESLEGIDCCDLDNEFFEQESLEFLGEEEWGEEEDEDEGEVADTDEAVEAPQPMVWHLGLGGLEVWGGGCMKNLNLFVYLLG